MVVQLFPSALFCPIIILFLLAHSHLFLSSFVCPVCFFPVVLSPPTSTWGLSILTSPSFFISHCISNVSLPCGDLLCPVWVLQTQWAAPALWDGVLPRPFGGPTLGGGEAGIRTIIQKIFYSGLLSPPPLPPSGKTYSPTTALFLDALWCGWWCSWQCELLPHVGTISYKNRKVWRSCEMRWVS